METPAVVIRTISRYELVEEIGRGNMGVVYRVRDPAMDRIVAVKVIRLGFSLEDERRRVFLERFVREAQIAGKLNHPQIVSVHDFGSGEDPFIVMEHFPGASLSSLCEKGAVSPAEVEIIATQLASARLRARTRDHPPRRQAGERALPVRLHQAPRFRDREARGLLDLERLSKGELSSACGPGARRWVVLAAAAALGIVAALSIPARESVPEAADLPPVSTSEEPPTPEPHALPLRFVARHEHRIGHCTGALSLSSSGVRFETSRHGEWRWRAEEIDGLAGRGESGLELRGRSRERGKEDEEERFEFTHLRPALSSNDLRRYREALGLRD